MIKKIMIFCNIFMLSAQAFSQANSDWRSQFVKWNLGLNCSGGFLSNREEGANNWINKYTATLSVDVALSELFYYDSSDLYLQPFFETSLPVKSPSNNNLIFTTYAGGVHLKKYFHHNSEKGNFFLLIGGKLEYISWKLNYINDHMDQQYKSIKLDYVLNGGLGYVISDRIEVFALYSMGLSKAYATTDLNHMTNMSFFSLGLKVALIKNWWFSK